MLKSYISDLLFGKFGIQRTLRAKHIVIAVGGRPKYLTIPGNNSEKHIFRSE